MIGLHGRLLEYVSSASSTAIIRESNWHLDEWETSTTTILHFALANSLSTVGGVSAAVSKTAAAPIERVKLLIQNQVRRIAIKTTTSTLTDSPG
jgi:hypothetical protein